MDAETRKDEITKIKRFIAGLLLIGVGMRLTLMDAQAIGSQLILSLSKFNGLLELIGFGAILAGVFLLTLSIVKIQASSFRKRVRRGIWRWVPW